MDNFPGHYLVYIHPPNNLDEEPAVFLEPLALEQAKEFAIYMQNMYLNCNIEIAWECDVEDPKYDDHGFVHHKIIYKVLNRSLVEIK
jgi:hypothetical protein